MHNAELLRRYELVTSEQYKAIREEQLNSIVKKASSSLNADILRGMLLLINETDQWEQSYLAVAKKNQNKE